MVSLEEDDEEDAEALLLYVLVIAHPDDESMFFLPTICNLLAQKQTQKRTTATQIWILCLTRGNYDHLGSIRCQELKQVCDLLQIDELLQLDRPEMQDHPSRAWSIPEASNVIQKTLKKALTESGRLQQYSTTLHLHLITFDEGGVSGHVNHRDCYRAVRYLYNNRLQSPLELGCDDERVHMWTLETVRNPIRKYLPIFEWMLFLWYWLCTAATTSATASTSAITVNKNTDEVVFTYRWNDPRLNWKAMATHHSQFVWYRRLFVVFSCYTFVNRLRRQSQGKEGGGEQDCNGSISTCSQQKKQS